MKRQIASKLVFIFIFFIPCIIGCNFNKTKNVQTKESNVGSVSNVLVYYMWLNAFLDEGGINPNAREHYEFRPIEMNSSFLICAESMGLYKVEIIGDATNISIEINNTLYKELIGIDGSFSIPSDFLYKSSHDRSDVILEIKQRDSVLYKCTLQFENCG